MSIDVEGMIARLMDHMLDLGLFDAVNGHEPKSAPGAGLTAAVWMDTLAPVAMASGLAATSARAVFRARLYTSMLSEPQDAIDPAMLSATSVLIDAYSGDFDLGGTVRNVDLLGAHGIPLSAQAGYLNQDGKLLRVVDITLPVIVNNAWTQAS